jgi:Na+-transporting NADH:ubiquinone oxidoreductase subunit NqrB
MREKLERSKKVPKMLCRKIITGIHHALNFAFLFIAGYRPTPKSRESLGFWFLGIFRGFICGMLE